MNNAHLKPPRTRAFLLSAFTFCITLGALALFQSELHGRLSAQNDLLADDACFQATQQFQSYITELKTAISDLSLFVEADHGSDSRSEEKVVLGLTLEHPGLEGVGVAQAVAGADRAAFENTYLHGRPILQFDNGTFDASPVHSSYVVLRNVDIVRNAKAFGLDLLSEPKRAKVITQASFTNQILLSEPLTNSPGPSSTAESNLIVKSADENFKKGSKLFVTALFRPSLLAEKSNGTADHAQIVEISDVTGGKDISIWRKPIENVPHIDRQEMFRFGGRVFSLQLQYLSPPESSGIWWLKAMVWSLGGLVCLLATVLVATLSFKRIHAEEHQRQLQEVAAEMMDELYETVPQALIQKGPPSKKP